MFYVFCVYVGVCVLIFILLLCLGFSQRFVRAFIVLFACYWASYYTVSFNDRGRPVIHRYTANIDPYTNVGLLRYIRPVASFETEYLWLIRCVYKRLYCVCVYCRRIQLFASTVQAKPRDWLRYLLVYRWRLSNVFLASSNFVISLPFLTTPC